MKKFTAILLGIALMTALAVSVSAGVRIITPDAGYEVYPILGNENVTFWSIEGDAKPAKIDLPGIAELADGIYGPGAGIQVSFAKNPEAHHLPAFKLVKGSDDARP